MSTYDGLMPPYTEQQRHYWLSAFACGPPAGVLVADFTITRGTSATDWYSRHGTQNFGSIAGDSNVDGNRVSRVRRTSSQIIFNTEDTPGWPTWWNANSATATITMYIMGAAPIVFTAAELNGVVTSALRFNQSAAVVAITATVAQGDEVRFVFRV